VVIASALCLNQQLYMAEGKEKIST